MQTRDQNTSVYDRIQNCKINQFQRQFVFSWGSCGAGSEAGHQPLRSSVFNPQLLYFACLSVLAADGSYYWSVYVFPMCRLALCLKALAISVRMCVWMKTCIVKCFERLKD